MSAPAISEELARVLRHMLGIDRPTERDPKPYRNYYCANPGEPVMLELVRLGLAEKYAERGGYEWYCCTETGRVAAVASHRAIRLPKSKRIYIKFLDVRDAFNDLTFKEFLTDPVFAESRRAA